jgi:hypothetical protein
MRPEHTIYDLLVYEDVLWASSIERQTQFAHIFILGHEEETHFKCNMAVDKGG